jgi:hypothetical protein
MPFVARSLRDSSENFYYEPLVFKPQNNLLKVRVLKGKVNLDGEYELSFTLNGQSYRYLGIPIDKIGSKVLFQLKELDEFQTPKSGAINLEGRPIPAQVCTYEGFCTKALCTSFSLDGADLLLQHWDGNFEYFKRLIEEKIPFKVVFEIGGKTYEVQALPVSFDKGSGKVHALFGVGEDNKTLMEIYGKLRQTQSV